MDDQMKEEMKLVEQVRAQYLRNHMNNVQIIARLFSIALTVQKHVKKSLEVFDTVPCSYDDIQDQIIAFIQDRIYDARYDVLALIGDVLNEKMTVEEFLEKFYLFDRNDLKGVN
jgi:hypothetical protein